MEILFVTPSFDVEKFKGISRYGYELYQRLSKWFDIEPLEVYGSKRTALANFTKVPFKELITKRKIIISMTPESCQLVPFMPGKTGIVLFHDLFPILESENLKYASWAKIYTKFSWSLSSRNKYLMANSALTAQQVKQYFGREARVANPGIEEKFKDLGRKKLQEEIVLGFFSNFSYRKRVDIAIEVFKKVSEKIDAKLVLAGGNIKSFYQSQFDVESMIHGMKNVEVIGGVPEEKVVETYNSFDFFLFPTMTEGFGIPIVEAGACGTPTLIMRDAKIPEETRSMAIKADDVDDMAKKILYCIENKKEYEKVREAAKREAKRFNWDKTTKIFKEVIESVK